MSGGEQRIDLVARDYWASARSAFLAATCCYHSESGLMISRLEIYPAFWNLIGFSIEASLKAFLAFNGISPERLRKEFGHDLQVLEKQAEQFGLEPSKAFSQLLDDIAPFYVKHQFRYLTANVDYVDLPPGPALATVDELLGVVLRVVFDVGDSAA